MADIWDKQKRSEVMSKIRGSGNKSTELRLIRVFKEYSIVGWRRNQKLLGRPDFIFRRQKVAVFVDGCFWHGCPRCYTQPKSSVSFWKNKVTVNRARDIRVSRELRRKGWSVARIWECKIGTNNTISRIERALKGRG